METNVKEGDVARVIEPGPYLGLILTVEDQCPLGTMIARAVCWHTSSEVAHCFHDSILRPLDNPPDDAKSQEVRPLPLKQPTPEVTA